MRIKLLEEIMEEICNEFNINIKKQREVQKSTYEIESSPIQVDTPTGLKIQVGRNMRQIYYQLFLYISRSFLILSEDHIEYLNSFSQNWSV